MDLELVRDSLEEVRSYLMYTRRDLGRNYPVSADRNAQLGQKALRQLSDLLGIPNPPLLISTNSETSALEKE